MGNYRVSYVKKIPADVLTQVQTKMQEVQASWPLICWRSPRRKTGKCPKWRPGHQRLVEKAYDFAARTPISLHPASTLIPSVLGDAHGLWTFHSIVQQVEEGIVEWNGLGSKESGRCKKSRRFGPDGNWFGKRKPAGWKALKVSLWGSQLSKEMFFRTSRI
jgi:hypothetical protein